ncbi:hypothetical protein F2P81_009969 [Scophthalmus maximus]|uniref:Uncharacterized protein n=1 Tax=Scophthalmus maximus TaxID=52904 RepID=A0A6A4SWJ8_SCOMX|nr:hypothetical protein F2P81_009969 [Scophthalmus maximus]
MTSFKPGGHVALCSRKMSDVFCVVAQGRCELASQHRREFIIVSRYRVGVCFRQTDRQQVDPELQDPLSLSLNENYNGRNSPHHDQKKAQASPDYNCDTPEISRVIIKEEEDGWTASDNDESYCSGGETGDPAAHTFHPHLKACEEESCNSHAVKRQCSEESGHMLTDSDAKPKVSCVGVKVPGHETADECNNTGERSFSCPKRETTPSHTRNDSPESQALVSHGLKMASANLEGQTLHLTVRLQAGEAEEGQEEAEEQDDEIGGLINSDGEVVEWDASPDRRSDCTEGPQHSKGVSLSVSRLQGQSQRDSSSPTLIMEVVSVGEDEEREEGEEEKERVVKMATVSPLCRGKRHRRKNKIPKITVAAKREVPANPVSRRSRRKRNVPAVVESEESEPKAVRRVSAKRPYRRRKETKQSAEGGENSGVSAGKSKDHVHKSVKPIW